MPELIGTGVLDVSFTGIPKLQARVQQLAFYALTNKVVRRGISEAAAVVARSIKNAAPVRKPRVSVRILDKLMKRRRGWVGQGGQNLSKATRKASIVQKKLRKIRGGGMGPRELIEPGLLKRSVHSRVIARQSVLYAKAGVNVGLRPNDRRRAPHAHLVAWGTKLRRTKLKGSRPGHITGRMPKSDFAKYAAESAVPRAMRLLESRVKEDFRASIRAVGGT